MNTKSPAMEQPQIAEVEVNGQRLSLTAFSTIYRSGKKSKFHYWAIGIFVGLMLFLFLPWTQNIRARGTVTTLRQEQRTQEINTVIGGRVKKWFVKEGDFVKAGDTLIQLGEIKDDYFDPELLARTREQLTAKESAIRNYRSKASMTEKQIASLRSAREFKLSEISNKIQQQRMKISADSMDMIAAMNDLDIKDKQYKRQQQMYDSGLVSLTQLEQRNQARQDALAKKSASVIKFNNARQEMARLQLEGQGVNQDYSEKISKAEGDLYQSLSQVAGGESEVAKLRNQYMNYSIRNGLYFITAPQDGQVVQAKKAGIGEIVKEGELIVQVVPKTYEHAVELYVRPVDLPLLETGQKIRFLFDGFPAIVFSGWPNASYGTFGGEVAAIENSISKDGKFRVLVKEDASDKRWPVQLKMGTGAQGIALLKDVPIWYELWRNINGFPPDYYKKNPEKPEKL